MSCAFLRVVSPVLKTRRGGWRVFQYSRTSLTSRLQASSTAISLSSCEVLVLMIDNPHRYAIESQDPGNPKEREGRQVHPSYTGVQAQTSIYLVQHMQGGRARARVMIESCGIRRHRGPDAPHHLVSSLAGLCSSQQRSKLSSPPV